AAGVGWPAGPAAPAGSTPGDAPRRTRRCPLPRQTSGVTDPALFGDPIVTGEAVALEMRPAGVGSRGIAFVVDVAVQYGLLALLPMLVSSRSKRIGDLAAGTIVVQERVPARIAPPPPMPPGLDGWARSLDLSQVGDGLALELRQFLTRSHQLAPWAQHQMG